MLTGAIAFGAVKVNAPVLASNLADLTIIEFKMTGSESIVIQNTTSSAINLKNDWLEYFNKNNPIFPSVTNGSQQLPDFTLEAGQTVLLSGDSAATCGASVVDNLGFSLSDTNGYLRVTKVTLQSDGASLLYTPLDHVSWTSTAASKLDPKQPKPDITDVKSATDDPLAVWYRSTSGGSWSPSQISGSGCGVLAGAVTPGGGASYAQLAKNSTSVPSSFAGAASSIPADDDGLAAPKLSEIQPNPAPPQTDANNEFIELYNSNSRPFDLSGFILEAGTTSLHKYTFPKGTTIAAHKFVAYDSSTTHLSLSNNGGQVKLLDPDQNNLEQSDVYDKAKDGYAWVEADGSWLWTTTPTPGAKNVITIPPQTASSKKDDPGSQSVLGASTSITGGSGSGASATSVAKPASLHPLILAGVGSLAVLYALYEYRHDLANTLYRYRRYRAARHGIGQPAETTDLARTAL